MIYLLNAIGLTPGGSSTVYICAQTIHRTTQLIMRFYNLHTLHETCQIYTTWDQRNEIKALFQNENKKKKLRASESCENIWTCVCYHSVQNL